MHVGYVYSIRNRVNGKSYVGCTKQSVVVRWTQHLSAAKNGSSCAIHHAIRKHGAEQFEVTVLQEVSGGHEDLMDAEIRAIETQGTLVPNGYNQARGGQGVDHSDTSIRERIGATQRRRNAEDPRRIENYKAAARRRCQDASYASRQREILQSRAVDPSWLQKIAETNARKVKDPEWRKAHAEGVAKRSSDPEWLANTSRANKDKATSADWIEANRLGQHKRSCVQAQKDALLDPSELKRRIRNREKYRRAQARRTQELSQ